MNPNDIVGTPREYDIWLAPDWSGFKEWKDGSGAPKSGWTRVSVRETLYANGRKVTEVLDENRQPITTRNLEETIDKDQEKRFNEAQDNAKPPGGITEKNVNGQVFRWNPQTRAYDIPTGQAPAPNATSGKPQGSTTQTEGTPLPGGGFDNERPLMVTRGPDGKVIESRELTPSEMTEWRNNRERSRNPGGKTDAEVRADADRNKPGAPTLKPDGKGGTIAVQQMPDGSIKTTPLPDVPSDKPSPERVTVNGVVYERGADGTYKPAAGIPAPTRGGKLPPGVKPPQFTRGNVANELTRFNQELDAAVSRGEISKEDATGFYTAYHQSAQTFLQEQNNSDSQDATASGQQLTQRSQNMTQAGNRLNWANSAFQNAANADQQMLLGAAGTGRSALVPLLTLQAGLANATGGFRNQPEVEVRRYPASIQPVAAATNTAATATGAKPGTIFTPKPPVSPAQAAAIAAQGRATAAGGAPTAGEPGGPPLAPGPVYGDPPPGSIVPPGTPLPTLPPQAQGPYPSVNPVTGEPTGIVAPAATPAPSSVGPSVNPDGTPNYGDPNMTVLPQPGQQTAGPSTGPTPVDMPGDPGAGYNPSNASQSGPIDPYTGLPRQSNMLPKSIQPAMPNMQGPDINAITQQMLADGADPMDVMEIRRRYARGAAA